MFMIFFPDRPHYSMAYKAEEESCNTPLDFKLQGLMIYHLTIGMDRFFILQPHQQYNEQVEYD